MPARAAVPARPSSTPQDLPRPQVLKPAPVDSAPVEPPPDPLRLQASTPMPAKAAPAEPLPQPSPPPSPPSADRVYTGGDLARFRAERGLTQRAAAELLGVAHGTVGKAELDQTRALGPALQAAMRRACAS